MKFRFQANVTFEARDIDDAMRVLSEHFRAVYCDMQDIPTDDIEMEYRGEIVVEPAE